MKFEIYYDPRQLKPGIFFFVDFVVKGRKLLFFVLKKRHVVTKIGKNGKIWSILSLVSKKRPDALPGKR
ncbi:protein of unknown function [Ruminococcaceae bacterium BL-6]|nr:protein of unknown function [Ruminococcaceae bacterium BL-6]